MIHIRPTSSQKAILGTTGGSCHGQAVGTGRDGPGTNASSGGNTQTVRSFRVFLSSIPLLLRAIIVGVVTAGGAGSIVGLLVGLAANPATAAFAVVELGLPAATIGAVVGLLVGLSILLARRIRRRPVR